MLLWGKPICSTLLSLLKPQSPCRGCNTYTAVLLCSMEDSPATTACWTIDGHVKSRILDWESSEQPQNLTKLQVPVRLVFKQKRATCKSARLSCLSPGWSANVPSWQERIRRNPKHRYPSTKSNPYPTPIGSCTQLHHQSPPKQNPAALSCVSRCTKPDFLIPSANSPVLCVQPICGQHLRYYEKEMTVREPRVRSAYPQPMSIRLELFCRKSSPEIFPLAPAWKKQVCWCNAHW